MASGYRRIRRGYNSGMGVALKHIEDARKLSEELGGTDVDVKRYFFSLPEFELVPVLSEYGLRYGESKREYAEWALPYWRTGRKKMSGLVAERLFHLLPPIMPLAVKYEMVQTLWEKYCPQSVVSFIIGPDCDPMVAVRELEQHLLGEVTHFKIPEPLEKRFTWLSAGDVAIRQTLLNHFLEEERKLIAADAKKRTHLILEHFRKAGQWTESIRQEYSIGNHRLEIFFEPTASGIQRGRPESKLTEGDTDWSGWFVAILAIIAFAWFVFRGK